MTALTVSPGWAVLVPPRRIGLSSSSTSVVEKTFRLWVRIPVSLSTSVICGPVTRILSGRRRYSSMRTRTVEFAASTSPVPPQPARTGAAPAAPRARSTRRRIGARAYDPPPHGPPSPHLPRPRSPRRRARGGRLRRGEGLHAGGHARARRRGAVLLALLGLSHARRGRSTGLGDQGPRPRARRRPELQPAQGDLPPGPLRDPQ